MKIKMGYPDNYDPLFDTLTVKEEDSFFDAVQEPHLRPVLLPGKDVLP